MPEPSVQKPEHKSGIVVFDTKFGNTGKIAKSIAAGLERAGVAVRCVSVGEAHSAELKDYDLIVVGAPTQTFTASKPMKEF
ncbi:MAG TPA: flavodoxin domain-containing protein, partial [Nitrososphaerales archaeon]|nr:flavodoxin domain-containing protein [Nitrososphaerales archaeon]